MNPEILLKVNKKFLLNEYPIDESMVCAFPVDYKIKDYETVLSEEEVRNQMLGKNRDLFNIYKTLCINVSYDLEKSSLKEIFKNDYCLNVIVRSMLYFFSITKDPLFPRLLLQMNPPNSVLRFLIAQNFLPENYDIALSEVKAGHKTSHWMWYIFPQFKGLGSSYMSNFYGIRSTKEAEAYLNHPILGKRLIEITQAYLDTNKDAIDVFDYDDVKLKSCMLLFASVSDNPIFRKVLKFNHW